MTKSKIYAAAAGAALLLAAGASQAQPDPGAGIDAKQAEVARRIDAGVAQNDLSRDEANRLRDELHRIERVEVEFRRGGLTGQEIGELNRRLDVLQGSIQKNRNDGDRRGEGGSSYDSGWKGIDTRQAELDRRIDAGVAQNDLTREEANRLRSEFAALQRLEHEFRKDGLTTAERQELDRRFDVLQNQIRNQRRDGDRR